MPPSSDAETKAPEGGDKASTGSITVTGAQLEVVPSRHVQH